MANKVRTCCFWCNAIVEMKPGFNEKKSKPFCSVTCLEAEMLFQMHYCDEEINRRNHYDELTRGED